jgi:hypothetical protein
MLLLLLCICSNPDAQSFGLRLCVAFADAEQAHLDPQQHLRAGRHGEWMAETLQVGIRWQTGLQMRTVAEYAAELCAAHDTASHFSLQGADIDRLVFGPCPGFY